METMFEIPSKLVIVQGVRTITKSRAGKSYLSALYIIKLMVKEGTHPGQ